MEVPHYNAIEMVIAALFKAGVVEPEKFRTALYDVTRHHIDRHLDNEEEIAAVKEFAVIVGNNSYYNFDHDKAAKNEFIPPDFKNTSRLVPEEPPTRQPPQKPPR